MNSGELRASGSCERDRLLTSAADSCDNGVVRSGEANEAEPVSVDATSVPDKHSLQGNDVCREFIHSENASRSGDKEDQSDIVDSSTSSPRFCKEGPFACVSDSESSLSSSPEYGCQSSEGSRKESSESESFSNTSSISLRISSSDGSYTSNESTRENQLLGLNDSSSDIDTHELAKDSLHDFSRGSSVPLRSSERSGGMGIRHVPDDHIAENSRLHLGNDLGELKTENSDAENESLAMECGGKAKETEILQRIRDVDAQISAANISSKEDGDEIQVVKMSSVSNSDGVKGQVSSNQNVGRRRDGADDSRAKKTVKMRKYQRVQDYSECTSSSRRASDTSVRTAEAGRNVKRPWCREMQGYHALPEISCAKTPVVPVRDCNPNDGQVTVYFGGLILPHEVGDRRSVNRSDESDDATAATKGDSRSESNRHRREDSHGMESEFGDMSCYNKDSESEASSVSLTSSSTETESSSCESVSSAYASVMPSGVTLATRCPRCGNSLFPTDDESPEIARDISVSSANSFPVPTYDINSYGEDDEDDISIESVELDYHYTSEDSSSSSEDSAIIVCTCCGCYSDCLAERGARVSESHDDSVPRALVSVGTNTDRTSTALQQPNEVRPTFVQITVYITVSLIL